MSYVYLLQGNQTSKDLLGNKGANLVTMYKIGLPVPPGFILSVDAFKKYGEDGSLPEDEIKEAMTALENQTGKRFGENLQVSVRSSASVSMPGMMDTLLNVKDYATIEKSVKQVFESWNGARAIEYRRINKIPPDLGTSAIIQAMVFGNSD